MKIKKDPFDLLKESKVELSKLSKEASEALKIYNESLNDFTEYPDEEAIAKGHQEITQIVMQKIKEEIDAIQGSETRVKKSKSLKEKSDKQMDILEECRNRIKEERKRKKAAGEIKPPKKKTLITRLKEYLSKVPAMMPKAIKSDTEKIEKTEVAVKKFLIDLKSIWGLNQIKGIEKVLDEKFSELINKATPQAPSRTSIYAHRTFLFKNKIDLKTLSEHLQQMIQTFNELFEDLPSMQAGDKEAQIDRLDKLDLEIEEEELSEALSAQLEHNEPTGPDDEELIHSLWEAGKRTLSKKELIRLGFSTPLTKSQLNVGKYKLTKDMFMLSYKIQPLNSR